MRRETGSDREAWTGYCEGQEACTNKYSAIREGKYASKREAPARPNSTPARRRVGPDHICSADIASFDPYGLAK